ncbi:hypothetical protein [Virgibacillus ainsalahensis]
MKQLKLTQVRLQPLGEYIELGDEEIVVKGVEYEYGEFPDAGIESSEGSDLVEVYIDYGQNTESPVSFDDRHRLMQGDAEIEHFATFVGDDATTQDINPEERVSVILYKLGNRDLSSLRLEFNTLSNGTITFELTDEDGKSLQ